MRSNPAPFQAVAARLRIAAGALVFATLLVAGSATAQTPSPELRAQAGAAFDRGTAALAARDFSAAAAAFEEANRLIPTPQAVVRAISAYRGMQDPEHNARAATLAAGLVSRYPNDLRVSSYAQRVVDELSPGLARVLVLCQGCTLRVDGTEADTSFFTTPGRHALQAFWGLRSVSRVIDVAAGTTSNLTLEPAPEPPPTPVPPTPVTPTPATPATPPTTTPIGNGPVDTGPSSGLHPALFITGLVATLGLAGTTVWSGLDVLAGNDVYVAHPTQALLDDGRSRELRTNILIGATAAVGATTVLLAIFTRWHSPRVSAAPTVSAMNGTAPGLTVQGSF